jgi:hypothetical protein
MGGFVIVPPLELAKATLPTPANVGITSAAVTPALRHEHVLPEAAVSAVIGLWAADVR